MKNDHVNTTLLFIIRHYSLDTKRKYILKEALTNLGCSQETQEYKWSTHFRRSTIHHEVRRQGTIPLFYFISSYQVLLLHTFQNLTYMVSSIFQVCYTYLETNQVFSPTVIIIYLLINVQNEFHKDFYNPSNILDIHVKCHLQSLKAKTNTLQILSPLVGVTYMKQTKSLRSDN